MRRKISVSILLVAVAALALWPTPAHAQRRHGGASVVVLGGGYFYDPLFWDPFWYPYYPAYQFYPPYPPYPSYYYGYGRFTDDASVRLEVKPKEAQVYVDGYYAGIVDDFDGVFQRLHVQPGDHELILYLDGYRSVHEHLSLARNGSYKVKYSMEKLAAGEPNEPKPVPAEPPQAAAQPPEPPQPAGPMRGPRRPTPGVPPPNAPPNAPPQESRAATASGYGVLAIRVQPADAEVLIDGEIWRGPQGEERLLVQVAEGPHRVEIRKQGRRTFSTDVTVRGGDTVPLNVSLAPGDEQ